MKCDVTVEPFKGRRIDIAIADTIEIARKLGHRVYLKFNGIAVCVSPDDPAELVYERYMEKRA